MEFTEEEIKEVTTKITEAYIKMLKNREALEMIHALPITLEQLIKDFGIFAYNYAYNLKWNRK